MPKRGASLRVREIVALLALTMASQITKTKRTKMMKHTDAMSVAQWIRGKTGKHCVEKRTCETTADGYWRYYIISHDIKYADLNKLIAEARQVLNITEQE